MPTMTTSGRTPSCWNAEELPGAAEARLDLVADEQHVVLLAERLDAAQIACGREVDAALPWIGSTRTAATFGFIARSIAREIAVGEHREAGRQRAEAVLVLRLFREADDRRRPPVEVAR